MKTDQSDLLIQPLESVGLNVGDLVLVEGEYLEGVEALEGLGVEGGDAVVVHVEDQQVVEVAEGGGGHGAESVLRQVQLRQPLACNTHDGRSKIGYMYS